MREQGTIFLGGPPLVNAATGEIVSAEELGGADVHCRTSARSHYALDDGTRSARARDRRRLNRVKAADLELRRAGRAAVRSGRDLRRDPAPLRKPYDVREVIARVVDGSAFDEFKTLYGSTLVCGFARICGYPVGHRRQQWRTVRRIALRRARISSSCAPSGASRCVFLQNITGFMVGRNTRPAASPRTARRW